MESNTFYNYTIDNNLNLNAQRESDLLITIMTELDDTKSHYQFILKIAITKRRAAEL